MIRAQDKISGLSETDPSPLHRPTRRIWAFAENPNKKLGACMQVLMEYFYYCW